MSERPKVLVAGSGPGALEATLALSENSSLDAEISLISPQAEFLYRPNLVMEPFGVTETARYSVGEIIAHERVQQWLGAIDRVDAEGGKAYSPEGDEFEFDALILATGARPASWLGEPAITMGTEGSMDALKQLVAEIDAGAIRNVVFTRPDGPTYSLPMYELALMTADRAARQSQQQIAVGVTSPEQAPLDCFGAEHAGAVAALCRELGVVLRLGESIIAYDGARATFADGSQLDVDRLVSMPSLVPSVPQGIPVDSEGFISVGVGQLVAGTTSVYAVGDVTNFPIKQGGLASQEADAAAAAIERQLGFGGPPEQEGLVIEATLLTTNRRLPLRAKIDGDVNVQSLPAEAIDGPSQKIYSRLLPERLRQISPLA